MVESSPPVRAFPERPPAPWSRPHGVGQVLEGWRADPSIRAALCLDHLEPAQAARTAPLPAGLAEGLRRALLSRGLTRLYTHQAEAFAQVAAGRDVVVATPTASGKSLAYNLPVLDALAKDPAARALYLFPTKALARDQEVALAQLLRDAGLGHGAVTFDGDTPQDARKSARERSGVVISNPDMLHAGILPHHAQWARFFSRLTYVVVDELHVYRGVFGSHLANVLRRLLRVAAFHGSSPRFLFASATIENPVEHARELLGRPVEGVRDSGAPRGARRVLCYNPPVVNRELGIRASVTKSAVRLTADLVLAGVPTILFGQSRNQVEVMLKYLRDRLVPAGVPAEQIQAYRGGYLAETRRRIELGLRGGDVRAVVSTSALELGVDIGSLDAAVCAGFPGTMAALWQRLGRAGRREGESLGLLVTSSLALDQYLAAHPELLVTAPVEEARIDPDNLEILLAHLRCAGFELPLTTRDGFGALPAEAVGGALSFLADHRVLEPVPDGAGGATYHWSADSYPASHVSLRSASWDNFAIVDVAHTRTIAEMDFRSAHTMLHEQAIYQQDGEQYQVERLDYSNHKAFVRRVEPDYYTTALTRTRVNVLAVEVEAPLAEGSPILAGFGEINVVEKVVGFKKIKFHTHENVGYGEVQLPEMQLPTTGLWLVVPESQLALFAAARPHTPRAVVIDALRGLVHALAGVAAVGLMMDPHDLGSTLVDVFDRRGLPPSASAGARSFSPTLYLYDRVAGGVGLAERLFVERRRLLARARRLLERCSCALGCPSCVGPVLEEPGEERAGGRRQVALALLEFLGVEEGAA